VDVRVEGLPDRLDGFGARFAQGTDEEPMRGRHALVEVRIRGPGRQGALERIEHRQDRGEGRAPAFLARRLLFARRPAASVVEVGAQSQIALLRLVERTAQVLDVVGGGG
jgi:hypothetical protein